VSRKRKRKLPLGKRVRKKKEIIRRCKICNEKLPVTNWLYCEECKKQIQQENFEEEHVSFDYAYHVNVSHFD